MISSGYWKVDEGILEKVLKEKGIEHTKKLLYEMLCWGGRISNNECEYWLNWLEKKVKENQKA